MPEIFMNLGFEAKYDAFGAELERRGHTVIRGAAKTAAELIAGCRSCPVAVAGAEDRWSEEVFDALKGTLGLVARFGVGTDNIDCAAAARRGIWVANSAGANKVAVAEMAIALMLACTRRIVYLDGKLRSGGWYGFPRSLQLSGKRIGLVGFGAIARCVAGMAAGFGCELAAYDVALDRAAAAALGVRALSLEELLATSDFVSLHVPYLSETRHMVSERFLAGMKRDAVLINTSRGGVVDEAALYGALIRGEIRMAGLDVFEEEPPKADNPLFALEQVVVTPHASSATEEAAANIAAVCLENIQRFLESGRPACPVNDIARRG